MRRSAVLARWLAGSAAALMLIAAQQPSPFAQAKAGDWELTGIPGVKANHQCIGDIIYDVHKFHLLFCLTIK